MKYIFLIFFICLSYSQDDLLDILNDGDVNVEYVQSAFKGTRVANAQSLEIPAPKVLQFMIQHRFGSIENGFYDLFGTDYAAIRYDFSYGFNDVLALGAGRSSFDKVYDIFLKTKLIRQSKGVKNFPISVVLFNDIGIKTNRKSEQTPALKEKFSNRLLYINQLIIGRKFNRNLSLQVLPTVIHRNLVLTPNEKHQLASLGFAGRYKITNQFSINADYFIPLDNRDSNYKNSFAVGFDYETGGHVFQVILSNAQGPYEFTFIEKANGDPSSGKLYLGFNISRAFSFKGNDSETW
tara:strand:+ start:1382 stop:2263 length:882 start_codon:yes stop_codon:yes gene_type:complete